MTTYTLLANCPRCGANRITFDVVYPNPISDQQVEVFSVCRACYQGVIFLLSLNAEGSEIYPSVVNALRSLSSDSNLNEYFDVDRHINVSDINTILPPKYLPNEIEKVFEEAVRCHAIGCWNAAGAMFRSSIDIATKKLMQQRWPNDAPKKTLAKRLEWLFSKGEIPEGLKSLSACIREDGNDAVHDATLAKVDADDLLDFTVESLKHFYTRPERIRLAEERRKERRENLNAQLEEDSAG